MQCYSLSDFCFSVVFPLVVSEDPIDNRLISGLTGEGLWEGMEM